MKTLAFLGILLISKSAFPDIVRLECQTYADFSVSLEGLADIGSILKSLIVKGLRDCVLNCISFADCKAVNYNKSGGSCELVSRGLNKHLIEKSGWVYLTTNDQERNVILFD